jgi:hypothetical protein
VHTSRLWLLSQGAVSVSAGSIVPGLLAWRHRTVHTNRVQLSPLILCAPLPPRRLCTWQVCAIRWVDCFGKASCPRDHFSLKCRACPITRGRRPVGKGENHRPACITSHPNKTHTTLRQESTEVPYSWNSRACSDKQCAITTHREVCVADRLTTDHLPWSAVGRTSDG